ncbi:MAG: hypothetical protein WC238_04630 [Parcubacteria group bacterium]|jgi:hypothetical protein
MTLEYTFGTTTLSSLGIRISESLGLLDIPKVKNVLMVDLPMYNGVRMLDSKPKYDGRDIILHGWMKADDANQFNTNIATLTGLLTAGIQSLTVSGFTTPLVYTVICMDGVTIDKKWRAETMVGEITIRLKEVNQILWIS